MALAFHCPHCGQALPVSAAALGQKVECARCQANFFLAPTHLQAPGGKAAPPPPAQPATSATGAAVATVAPPTPVAVPVAPRPVAMPASTPPTPSPLAPVSVKPAPVSKPVVLPATTLKAAPDGKLPTLSLEADAELAKKGTKEQGPSSVVVLATLAVSVTLSLAVLLVDFESGPTPTSAAAAARQDVQRFYGDEHAQIQPYQKLLREAQRAHTRGDISKERRCYRQVMELLRSEGRSVRKTLTGSAGDDAQLEQMLNVLLRDVQETSLF